MKNQELINELIERVDRIISQEESYMDLSLDVLSIDTTTLLDLDNNVICNLALLNKLLHERNVLMVFGVCSCLNSPEFYFKHEYLTSGLLSSLITYLDKELDTLSRITALYENLHIASIDEINERLLDAKPTLVKELQLVTKSNNEWIQLYSLMFSENE